MSKTYNTYEEIMEWMKTHEEDECLYSISVHKGETEAILINELTRVSVIKEVLAEGRSFSEYPESKEVDGLEELANRCEVGYWNAVGTNVIVDMSKGRGRLVEGLGEVKIDTLLNKHVTWVQIVARREVWRA